MSKGTKIRSIRVTDNLYNAITEWGQTHLGTDNFSTIVRHLIEKALGGK